MIRMTKISSLLLLVFLPLSMACKQKPPKKASPDDLLPIELKTVQLGPDRWEYDIYVDHKMYIKQDRIPAVPGLHAFINEEEAKRTGQLVIEKIKKGQIPALSSSEIEKLNITIR